MNLSGSQKLTLFMLSEIHEKLDIKNGIDASFVKEAIHSGNEWARSWKYGGIIFPSDEYDEPAEVREVADILDLWIFIKAGYQALSDEDKKVVNQKADVIGDTPRFNGFDGNNEVEHLSIASFLIKEMGSWQLLVKPKRRSKIGIDKPAHQFHGTPTASTP